MIASVAIYLGAAIDQVEQTTDLLDGKAEFPRAEDEAQTHQVFLVVQTIARHRARLMPRVIIRPKD